MDTIYSIPPLHIMGSLIYDYCRISASGSGGDQIYLLYQSMLLLLALLALYHEKVDDKLFFFDGNLILYPLVNEVRSLSNGNITDIMVFFLFPFRH